MTAAQIRGETGNNDQMCVFVWSVCVFWVKTHIWFRFDLFWSVCLSASHYKRTLYVFIAPMISHSQGYGENHISAVPLQVTQVIICVTFHMDQLKSRYRWTFARWRHYASHVVRLIPAKFKVNMTAVFNDITDLRRVYTAAIDVFTRKQRRVDFTYKYSTDRWVRN